MMEQLKTIMPPPASPVAAGAPERWGQIEKELGIRLPRDYKQLIQTYGAGEFGGYLIIHSPFFGDGDGNLLHECHNTLEFYRDVRQRNPERMIYPPFPDPGGVLPLGRAIGGVLLFWVTEGDPDEWPVLLSDPGAYEEVHHRTVTELLTLAFTGALESRLLPDDIAEEPLAFVPYNDPVGSG